MAEETIQDDHPDFANVTVPRPTREPITIEGHVVETPSPAEHLEGATIAHEDRIEAVPDLGPAQSIAFPRASGTAEHDLGSARISESNQEIQGAAPTSGNADVEPRVSEAPVDSGAFEGQVDEGPTRDSAQLTVERALEDGALGSASNAVRSTEQARQDSSGLASEVGSSSVIPPTSNIGAPPASASFPARAFVFAGLGALFGAIVSCGAAYLILSSDNQEVAASQFKALSARVAAIEARPFDGGGSVKLSGLEARLGKLEGVAAKAEALTAVAAEAKAARESADKVAAAIAAVENRIAANPAAGSGYSPSTTLSSAGDAQALSDRVAKLEATVNEAQHGRNSTLGPDLVKLAGDESSLEQRVAKLDNSVGALQHELSAGALDKVAGAQTLEADRIGKLESSVADLKSSALAGHAPELVKLSAEENSLVGRVAKLEAAFSAPKTEVRAAPEFGAQGDPIAKSVTAIALDRRLRNGQSYVVEYAALEKLMAKPEELSALKPYAQTGAPTAAALESEFSRLAPALSAPIKSEKPGDYVGTIWDEVKGLVKVRQIHETKGDDPASIVTQISGALLRDDIATALIAFGKLPEIDRLAASSWANEADGVLRARATTIALIESSLIALTGIRK